jgi:hypothetical protein
MKKTFLLSAFALISLFSFGQRPKNRITPNTNSIYIEFFGQGIVGSLNYEHMIQHKKIKTSSTIGVITIPSLREGGIAGIPFSYNVIFGNKKSHFEVGTGLSIAAYSENGALYQLRTDPKNMDYYTYFTPKIGYRWQKPEGGLFFRVTYNVNVSFINYTAKNHSYSSERHFEYFEHIFSFKPTAFPELGLSVGHTIGKKEKKSKEGDK